MKKSFVIGIFLILGILVGIGCQTPTLPSQTPTQSLSPTATSTEPILETQTPTPTATVINETAELVDVVLFQFPKNRETITTGYGLELTFSMGLDLDSITSEDATQYINLFCNRIRIRSWNGEIYINPDQPQRLIIAFGEDTNFSCDPENIVVAPVKGMLRVQNGGYVKGMPKDIEEIPGEDPKEYGGVCPNEGECPHDFSINNNYLWHTPQHQEEHPNMTPPPHETECPNCPHATPTETPTGTV